MSSSLPSNMATSIYSIKELGSLIAESNDLDSGKYEVVIEFKLGSIQLGDEKQIDAATVPAMAVGIGGVGLRPFSGNDDGAFIIDHVKKAKAKNPK
ncbi:hypothetical protein MKP15_04200 [Stenotrophomonas sp. Y6]|uniref:hypothetical protein n=1 Tax=Stenotrophomonas sp. Y6 TaxID=2920383 RepID=UPI001F05C58E|nr:hypothetical protein [Stenotrophomonas sp. Y6]MCH1907974.1 hypothetical protein [Stenotrophomonas sp. Y6]